MVRVPPRSTAVADTDPTVEPDAPAALDGSRVDAGRRQGRAASVVRALGWILVVGPFVAEIVAVLRANHLGLVRRVPDDALYYAEIAARVGRGEGFTFDGIHSTNGFHPLWQAVLVPVVGGLGPGTDAAIRGILVVGVLVSLAAVLLSLRLVARVTGSTAALVGAVVATQLGLTQWVNGMEGPVVLLAVSILAWSLAAADRHRTAATATAAGAAAALCVLARLDLAPLLVLVAVVVAVRWRSPRLVAQWCLGTALVGVPAAVWWMGTWGHVLSTSATVKRATLGATFDARFGGRLTSGYVGYLGDVASEYTRRLAPWSALPDRSVLVTNLGVPRMGAAACGLALFACAAVGWGPRVRAGIAWIGAPHRTPLGPDGWAIAVVASGVLGKAVADIVTAPLWATAWYSAPQRLVVGFGVGVGAWWGVCRIARSTRAGAAVAAVMIGVLLLPVNGAVWASATRPRAHDVAWQDQLDLTADWIRASGPRGRYGARDAGLLGYRLDGIDPVVNLDGLVNDYRFAQLVVDGTPLVELVRATRVEYFVGRLDRAGAEPLRACGAQLWRSPAAVPYADSLAGYDEAPVRVIDVRGCLG